MKQLKLILTAFLTATLGFCSFGQNPTLVYGTDGVAMKPTNIHAGKVYVGLDTNLTGFAANTGIKWNGTAFVWDTFGGSGLPTNWTWSAANPSVLTNSIVGGAFTISTGGPITNNASAFTLNIPGTGAISIGGNSTFNDPTRSANGWGLGSTLPNAGWYQGASLALREAIYNTTGNINSADNGVINYCDASAGPITLTLPAANANRNKLFSFEKIDTTTNGVTFVGAEQGYVLRSKGDQVTIHCNDASTVWRIQGSQSYPKRWSQFHDEDTVITGAAMVSAADANYNYCHVTYQNPAATNDTFRSYFNLKQGTYTFKAQVALNASHGIVSWYVDDVLIGTNDLYAAALARDQIRSIASVTITNSGTHKIEGRMLSKNASSSDFFAPIVKWWLEWTSD